jgi:hypothetical protein
MKSRRFLRFSFGLALGLGAASQLSAGNPLPFHRARQPKVYIPAQSDLEQVLDAARLQWGVIDPAITIRMEPFAECESGPGKAHMIAKSEMDGSRLITINSNCNWAEFSLKNTVLHEYGHIVLGTAEHSTDPRSVMYAVVLPTQTITDADRARLKAKME